jgi:SulP family sulfate permease
VLPALLVAGITASHGMRLLSGISLSQASAQGWFLEPISSSSLAFWPTDVLAQVQWGTLLGQSPNLAPLIGVVAINVLLDATGTEIAVGRDADLDRELRANGDANLFACLAGGMFGYFSMCFSLLNNKAGGTRRVSGLIAALLCAFALWKGGGSADPSSPRGAGWPPLLYRP